MNNPVDQPKVSELIERLNAASLRMKEAVDSEWMPEPPAINDLLLMAYFRLTEAANALAALPQPQATTAGVRTLEWREEDNGDFVAQTIAEDYRVQAGIWTSGYYWARDEVASSPYPFFDEPEQAKAAAQLDYDTRIRSALIGIPGAEKGEAAERDMVLVPREPTPEMIAAWPRHNHGAGHERAIYRAMVEAAPPAPTSERVQALSETDGWRLITDNPPLDREFLGANVGLLRRDGSPRPDGIWHLRGRHIDYAGGPARWTWNEANSGGYGIILTHWREMPALPALNHKSS